MMTLVNSEEEKKKPKDDGKDRDNEPRPLDVKVGYKLGGCTGQTDETKTLAADSDG